MSNSFAMPDVAAEFEKWIAVLGHFGALRGRECEAVRAESGRLGSLDGAGVRLALSLGISMLCESESI